MSPFRTSTLSGYFMLILVLVNIGKYLDIVCGHVPLEYFGLCIYPAGWVVSIAVLIVVLIVVSIVVSMMISIMPFMYGLQYNFQMRSITNVIPLRSHVGLATRLPLISI